MIKILDPLGSDVLSCADDGVCSTIEYEVEPSVAIFHAQLDRIVVLDVECPQSPARSGSDWGRQCNGNQPPNLLQYTGEWDE